VRANRFCGCEGGDERGILLMGRVCGLC
jgi:hypothetical protein